MEREQPMEGEMTDKETRLEEIKTEIDQIADNLGRPIDPGIKEAVVMMNAFGLHTTGSCEGHTGDEEGRFQSPFVQVYPHEPDDENWPENDELRSVVEREALEYQSKTLDLLNQFYENRDVPYEYQLHMSSVGYGYHLRSIGAIVWGFGKRADKEKIERAQKEMADFTDFLKAKY